MRGTPTGHAALRVLSERLKGEMPQSFQWEYYTVLSCTPCGTAGCAIGLATELWPDKADVLLAGTKSRAEFFDIPADISEEIFFFAYKYHDFNTDGIDVTPADVARLIDHYLEHGRLPPSFLEIMEKRP